MAIRYHLPFANAQQGPTCWYTAAKMMLRFHEMIGPAQSHRSEWLQLHELRKIITELAREKRPHDHRAVLTSIINRLNATGGASHERSQLRSLKNKWENAGSDDRFSVLDAFLPGLIKPVKLGHGQYDATFVEASLRQYGPLYASVYRPGASLMDMDYAEDPLSPRTEYVYRYDSKTTFGGKHAIVIFGVDGQENIYYADPNSPHRYSMIPWGAIKGQLNSPGGSMGDALFGRVECPGCHHIGAHQP
jgi:hypothetical protein